MKSIVTRLLLLALALGTARSATSQDVTVSFTGTLTVIDQSPYSDISVGMPFRGVYTYSMSTPDDNPLDQVGD